MRTSVSRNLKRDGSHEPDLVLNEMVLPSGSEWSPQLPDWVVIHVSSGVGYWMHKHMNHELQGGTIVLYSGQIQGCIRASQVGELRLHYFRAEPGKLTGLVTMVDQRILQNAAVDEKLSMRIFPPNALLSNQFKNLFSKQTGNSLPRRVQLLLLFLEMFGGSFEQSLVEVATELDASVRLRQMLSQMPVSELISMSFSELVSKTKCSPRHVSRLFTELAGVSFREKQVEVRLARACQLLAATDSKVVDVAMESGYQSTSLFNLKFKQRFGVSPAKWRERVKKHKPTKKAVRRLRLAA